MKQAKNGMVGEEGRLPYHLDSSGIVKGKRNNGY